MSAQDTSTELWGGETRKAVDNFPVSGERVPVHVVRWLGRIKGAAARTNAELGLLDDDLARRIAEAGDEIAEGSWYVVSGTDADAFVGDTDTLRRDVLRRQPGTLAWHATRPVDPDLN